MLPEDSNGASHIGPGNEEPEHRPAQSKTVKVIIWIAVLAIFATAYVLIERHKTVPAQTGGGRRGQQGGLVVLTEATAKSGDIGVYVQAIGTVTPVYTANIIAQATGIVTAVHFTEGQLVGKGTPLIEIDPRPYQATLTQAEGTLEHDQGVLAQAQMDLERYRGAWAKNAIPKQTLDDQEKIVLQDQGTVKFDEGVVAYDKVQLGYCHIVSPISGRVGLRLVDPGNVVSANGTTVLAVVTQLQPITAVFSVPEDSLGQITPRLQQKAKLNVDAFDRTDQNKIESGTLLTLDNQIDTTTGTVKARATFANKDGALYPNQFINAKLLVNTQHNMTLIPSSAIQHNGTQAYVYAIQNDVAHLKKIQEGVTDAGNTSVTGINAGDVVANSGFEKLQEGSKVSTHAGNGGGGGKGGRSGGKKTGSSNSGSPTS
jgi:multidrug efflux system membrane fusion protein